jgi:hypothetical protein
MLLADGNPVSNRRRQRHNVTALILSILRSVGPVTHRDSCAAASLRFDVKARRCRLATPRRGPLATEPNGVRLDFAMVPPQEAVRG